MTTSGILLLQGDQTMEHPRHPLLDLETFLRNGVMVPIQDKQFVESRRSVHLNSSNNEMDSLIVQDVQSWKRSNVQQRLEQGS